MSIRGHAICRRTTPTPCLKRFDQHHGPDCPDGKGTFVKREQTARISNSFSEGEVELLDMIRQGLVHRGKDLSHLARHPDFPSLARKVLAMRESTKSAPSGAASSQSPAVRAVNTHLTGADASTRAGG